MSELKPCPFCGGKAAIYATTTGTIPNNCKHYCYCTKCYSSGKSFEDIERDGSSVKKMAGICLVFYQDGEMVTGGFLISLPTGWTQNRRRRITMVKSKRIVRSFINFLFQEYSVPRIPVRLYWYYPAILVERGGTVAPAFGCYHHDDYDETSRCIHAIAGTKFGTNMTLRIIAHEFVHYLQDIHNRDFNDSAEEEAAYYADALVGKFLQNRRKDGIHIDGVLTVWEPPKEESK